MYKTQSAANLFSYFTFSSQEYTCPSPYTFTAGLCLYGVASGMTKDNAEKLCEDTKNGEVIEIFTQERQDAVMKYFQQNDCK